MRKIVTTSWDDGCREDLRTAELLRRYRLQGTFYIHSGFLAERGGEEVVKSLANEFEIGAHTSSHSDLTAMSASTIIDDVRKNRRELERHIGKKVETFCFPQGRYNHRCVDALRGEGFLGLRTTDEFFTNSEPRSPLMHVSLQVFPHKRWTRVRHALRYGNWGGLSRYLFSLGATSDWKTLALRLFDSVDSRGGVWHLWGHSWEIERYDLWRDLEGLFSRISGRQDISYLSNSSSRGRERE